MPKRKPSGSPFLAAIIALAAFAVCYMLGLSGSEIAVVMTAVSPFLIALARRS
jgi:drug/metabolite transporter (DMT)-like permease